MKSVPLFDFFLSLLFPPRCAGCNALLPATNEFFCDGCKKSIRILDGAYCPQCKRRLSNLTAHPHASYVLIPVTDFGCPAVRNAIHLFKYKRFRALATLWGKWIFSTLENLERIHSAQWSQWVIVPVPLHPRRLRERGFNQSEEIARDIFARYSAATRVPLSFAPHALKRIKYTAPQARFQDAEKRKANLKDSFAVADEKSVRGKNILLVDDVTTTGATLEGATAALRKNGARRVIAVIVAKAF